MGDVFGLGWRELAWAGGGIGLSVRGCFRLSEAQTQDRSVGGGGAAVKEWPCSPLLSGVFMLHRCLSEAQRGEDFTPRHSLSLGQDDQGGVPEGPFGLAVNLKPITHAKHRQRNLNRKSA